jgi:energy-coupling factor transport system ATP-binding protein
MLRVNEAEVWYNRNSPFEVKALQIDSIKLDAGVIYGIAGHTGSGKSTFCKLVAGLIEDMEHFKFCDDSNQCYEVGYVFQQPEHQIFETSVKKEMEFGLENKCIQKECWTNFVYRALSEVGLAEVDLLMDPMLLSGGQKRRLALASVLVYQPEILILDEPLAGVDEQSRKKVINSVLSFVKNGGTVFWVSHQINDLLKFCDKCLYFEKGELKNIGTALDVLDKYAHEKTELLQLCAEYKNKYNWQEKPTEENLSRLKERLNNGI